MKKIVSVVLAVLVAVSMFTFMATAASDLTATVSADKTSVDVGDVITVTVSVPKESKLAALDVSLKYDTEKFDYVAGSATFGDFMPDSSIFNTETPGAIRVIAGSATHFKDKLDVVFTAQLKAKAAGETNLTLAVKEAAIAVYNETTEQYTDHKVIVMTANSVKVEIIGAEVPPATDPTDPTDPSEHTCDYSDWKVTKKPTCTEAGEKVRVCKVCGEEDKAAIAATGHDSKWVVTKAPTTTATGLKELKCSNCGKVLDTAVIAKLPADSSVPSIPNTDAIA